MKQKPDIITNYRHLGKNTKAIKRELSCFMCRVVIIERNYGLPAYKHNSNFMLHPASKLFSSGQIDMIKLMTFWW